MEKFIMIGHPRTGSSLLRDLIDQNPQCRMHSEIFHPIEKERKTSHLIQLNPEENCFYENTNEDAFEFLDRTIWRNDQEIYASVGFKLFSERLDSPGTKKIFSRIKEERKDIKIIHLTRENLLDIFISRKLAEKSGVWRMSLKDNREKYDSVQKLSLNFDELLRFFEFTSMMTNFFRNHFSGENYLEISYDKLTKNTNEELNRVFRHVSSSPHDVKITMQKQNKKNPAETVENFQEIASAFEKTPYFKNFIY